MGKLREKCVVSLDVEDVYGTYKETAQVDVLMRSLSAISDFNKVERPDMNGSEFELIPCNGQIVRTVNYEMDLYLGNEIGYILNGLLGAATTTGASADKTHLFWYEASKMLVRSLCAEVVLYDGQTAQRFDGIYPGAITFSGDSTGTIKVSFTLPAQGRAAGDVKTTLVFSAICPAMAHHAKVYYDSGQIYADSWSVTLDPNIKHDNFKSGSQEIYEPELNGGLIVTATFTHNLVSETFQTAYEAEGTVEKFQVVITLGTLIGETATPYSLTLELPAAMVIAPPTRDGDTGACKETVQLKGFVGTSTNTKTTNFEAVLVNAATSYTARP